jgi:small subunit ribosomal protein S20
MRQAGEREEHEIRSSAPCANQEKQLLWQVFFRHSRNTDLSMANTAQAKKRARQNEATRKRNTSLRSALRTAVRNVRKAIATGDKAAATKELQAQQSVIDRIADKKIVHKNLAARNKHRLSQAIKALA